MQNLMENEFPENCVLLAKAVPMKATLSKGMNFNYAHTPQALTNFNQCTKTKFWHNCFHTMLVMSLLS